MLRPPALAILLLAPVLGAVPVPAAALSCADHATMVRHLAQHWGESRQAIALDAANSVVEMFASPETGSWTITVTEPGGPTCMVASGHFWEQVSEPLPVSDQGA